MTYRKQLVCLDAARRSCSTVKTFINKYEQMPFDGGIFDATFTSGQISGNQALANWVASTYAVDWASLATSLSDAQTTTFRRFSENFVLTKTSIVTGYALMDWWSEDVRAFIWNMRMAARFAKAAHFRGVFFDPEPDNIAGLRLWKYTDRPYAASKTFSEYKTRVKQIGQWTMEAMQDEFATMQLTIAFGYEQAIKQHNPPEEGDNYGLYGSFLDGLFSAKSDLVEINNYYEDGYASFQDATFNFDLGVQLDPDQGIATTSRIPASYVRGFASSVDLLTSTNLQAGIQKGIDSVTQAGLSQNIVEHYAHVYSNAAAFFGASGVPGVSNAVINAVEAARVTVGFNRAFDPALLPGLIMDFRPSQMGLANNDPVTSYTDSTGLAFTQSGGNRPTFKTDGIATGVNGVLFTAASSQSLVCDALAGRLVGTADIPFTIVLVVKLASLGTSYSFWSVGRDATTDPDFSVRQASTNFWRFHIQDDAGGNLTTTMATASDTNAHVLTACTSGTLLNFRADGSNAITTNPYVAQDYGTMTLNKARLGCLANNVESLFLNGTIGRVVMYDRCYGLDAIRWLEYGLGYEAGITVAGA